MIMACRPLRASAVNPTLPTVLLRHLARLRRTYESLLVVRKYLTARKTADTRATSSWKLTDAAEEPVDQGPVEQTGYTVDGQQLYKASDEIDGVYGHCRDEEFGKESK